MSAAAAVQEGPKFQIIEGYLYDALTGECQGPVDLPQAQFIVDTEDKANWVLGKFQEEEAAIESLLASPEVVKARAVLANALEMKKRHESRIKGLHFRFDEDLKEFARSYIRHKEKEGKKASRNFQSVYGKIQLTKEAAKLKVPDPLRAIAWATDRNFDDCIFTPAREWRISGLPDDAKDLILAALEGPDYQERPDSSEEQEEYLAARAACEQRWEEVCAKCEKRLPGFRAVFECEPGGDRVTVKVAPKELPSDGQLVKL